jgi:lysyl-tRNA synthetase, class II
MLRVERHHRGPRVYLLGRRVHEWQLGGGIILGLLVSWVWGIWGLSFGWGVVAVAAAWLVVKDWRDLVPSRRDTSAWRLGVHRAAAPLRAARRSEGLPALAAAVALTVGVVNLLSALTPNIAWRGRLLLQIEPVEAVPILHTLALPASVALIMAGFYLAYRRRRAWQAAFWLLIALGALNLLKGLDFEEALISLAGAALLWWGRDAFHVRHDRIPRSALLLPFSICLVGALLAVGVAWAAAPVDPGFGLIGRETADMLTWRDGPMAFHDNLSWVPLAVGAASLFGLALAVYTIFRPLSAPTATAAAHERRTARDLVQRHGSDTLAFFKLRRDAQYLFSPDRSAFLGYRVRRGVMVVAGDPVGPAEALPRLLREALDFAAMRGLRLAVLGASADVVPMYRQAGLRTLYIGDEAIVDTASFSLEGRAIRKVRQSVHRLCKAGFDVSAHTLGELDLDSRNELAAVSMQWLQGDAERGFAMTLDSVGGEGQADSVVVLARDRQGSIRGFLHFVPVYGRPAMSLSLMRRARDTPNGLTEFLVVRAIELLRERGVEELSLNFAAFARFMHRPRNGFERILGRGVGLANPFFQIESLYRFNAKFFPRWKPRYLVYEGTLRLPRASLAVLLVEGQLPSPRLPLLPARA